MKNARKSIALTVAASMSLGLCASAHAENEASVSIVDNDSALVELSTQNSSAPTLEGAVLDVKRADIPAESGKTEIPIENSSGMLVVDVQITKGGEYIESVSVKNNNLVVKVRNPGSLTKEKEYAADVTLYDMGTGKSSKFTVTGMIGASQSSSSSEPDNGNSTYWPDSSSKPDSGSSSSTQEKEDKISLKGAVNDVVTANLYKYGGDDEAEIQITAPQNAGTIRLKEKDIIKGRDVIRKVSVSGKKLMVEAKFPYEMLDEPKDYEIQVTLEDSGSGKTAVFTVKGSVYWQDTDAPVSPDEYREKKYVVVDFDGNDGQTIHFKNGSIHTNDLKSGVANLDISYSGSRRADFDGLDLYCVSFPANPRLDHSVTVCLDADEGNCVYEVGSSGKLTKLDATYNKSNGELRFETRRLGEYVVTEKALEKDSDTAKSSSSSTASSSETDTEKKDGDDIPTAKEKHRDNDGSDESKTVPNTGRYISARSRQ